MYYYCHITTPKFKLFPMCTAVIIHVHVGWYRDWPVLKAIPWLQAWGCVSSSSITHWHLIVLSTKITADLQSIMNNHYKYVCKISGLIYDRKSLHFKIYIKIHPKTTLRWNKHILKAYNTFHYLWKYFWEKVFPLIIR